MSAFASGLLGSYSDRLHEQNLLELQDRVSRRKAIADSLLKRMSDPEERPEAKEEYWNQLQILHNTPAHKELPKEIGRFSINIKPQEGKSLSKAPAQSGTTPSLPQIPGSMEGPEGLMATSAPAPGAGLAMPRLPEPPAEVSRRFSPSEMGQRDAARALPGLEQKAAFDSREITERAEAPIKAADLEAKKLMEVDPKLSYPQALLMARGKMALLQPKVKQVVLDDGSTVWASEVPTPGGLPKFYSREGDEITERVKRLGSAATPRTSEKWSQYAPGKWQVEFIDPVSGKTLASKKDVMPRPEFPSVTTRQAIVVTERGIEVVPLTSSTQKVIGGPVQTSPPASTAPAASGAPREATPPTSRGKIIGQKPAAPTPAALKLKIGGMESALSLNERRVDDLIKSSKILDDPKNIPAIMAGMSNPEGWIGNVAKGLAMKNTPPAVKNYIVGLRQLQEDIFALRPFLGNSPVRSDKQVDLLLAQVPNKSTLDSDTAKRQLEAYRITINEFKKQMADFKKRGETPVVNLFNEDGSPISSKMLWSPEKLQRAWERYNNSLRPGEAKMPLYTFTKKAIKEGYYKEQ